MSILSYNDIKLLNIEFKNNLLYISGENLRIKTPTINIELEQDNITLPINFTNYKQNSLFNTIEYIRKITNSDNLFSNNCIKMSIDENTTFFNKEYKKINRNRLNKFIKCKILFEFRDNNLFVIQLREEI